MSTPVVRCSKCPPGFGCHVTSSQLIKDLHLVDEYVRQGADLAAYGLLETCFALMAKVSAPSVIQERRRLSARLAHRIVRAEHPELGSVQGPTT